MLTAYCDVQLGSGKKNTTGNTTGKRYRLIWFIQTCKTFASRLTSVDDALGKGRAGALVACRRCNFVTDIWKSQK